jgi:hypothetical protein
MVTAQRCWLERRLPRKCHSVKQKEKTVNIVNNIKKLRAIPLKGHGNSLSAIYIVVGLSNENLLGHTE